MTEVIPGIHIKAGTTVGAGPESRLIPAGRDILKTVVPNKKKPMAGPTPQVPGVTYSPPMPG